MKKYGKGWYNESKRHALAAKGIKTGRKFKLVDSALLERARLRRHAEELRKQGKKVRVEKYGPFLGLKVKDYAKNSIMTWGDTGLGFLVHSTPEKNIKIIKKEGLRLSKNPSIIKGIYTIPIPWLCKDPGGFKGMKHIGLEIDKNAVYFDSKADYPMDAIYGYGSDAYKKLYIESMIELDDKYSVLRKHKVGSDKWIKYVDEVIETDKRKKFNKIIYNKLRNKNVDLFQHGGETIILNPKVIKRTKIFDDIQFKRICKGKKK